MMFGLSPVELCLIGAIAVMLYGKRLPEVGRSVGASIAEFRRQWASLSSELDVSAHIDGRATAGRSARRLAGRDADRADSSHAESPRFDPPGDAGGCA
ncbi:MAG: twin-arginine translocase TatA/TatE family subunit [Planctomycetia bacterium]